MLQDRLELSERLACRVTGQHRSTQRRLPARSRGDDALRTELHAFSRGHPRWGYRQAWATGPADAGIPRKLREEGWGVNRKRVQRLWRETPQDAKGSSSEVRVVGTVIPGGGLVVAGAGPETAVQVADEAVGEGA